VCVYVCVHHICGVRVVCFLIFGGEWSALVDLKGNNNIYCYFQLHMVCYCIACFLFLFDLN